MVVISTNNGWDYINRCIDAWRPLLKDGDQLCIVDTNSSSHEYKDYLKTFECNNIHVRYLDYGGYDFGAYKFAYEQFKEESWFLFNHDSIIPKHPTYLEALKCKLNLCDVVALIQFQPYVFDAGYLTPGSFFHNWLIDAKYSFGIYGSNFITRTSVLEKVYLEFKDIKVSNKEGSCGMERGWPIIFEKYGLNIMSLEPDKLEKDMITWNRLWSDNLFYFTKAKHKIGSRQ